MEILNFNIDKTAISLTSYTMTRPYLTGHNTDYLCVFTLSDEWQGLTKYATFYNTHSGTTEARLLSEGMCRIPYASLTYGDLEIGVVGKNGALIDKSSLTYVMPVQADATAHEDEIEEPDDNVYQQIIAKLALIDRGIQSAAVRDGHLYIVLTNDDIIDCGSIVSAINGHSIEFAYVNNDGELILVRTNGEQVNCGAIGGANFPEITAADEGKMLQIIDGQWALVRPPVSLPEVTTLQNGQVLRVLDGAWQVAAADRSVTSAYINEDGELILVFNDGVEYTHPIDNSVLPVLTANDENKMLKVVNGEWALVSEPSGTLPGVGVSDNGKVLKVVDGAWQVVDPAASSLGDLALGDGLEIVNGTLQLDMEAVSEQIQDTVDETAMSPEDIDDLFNDVFDL